MDIRLSECLPSVVSFECLDVSSVSFLLPWFSWGEKDSSPWIAGVHLIASLWLYDAMFTYGLIN